LRIVIRCTSASAARDAQTVLAAAELEAIALPGPPESAREAPDGEDVVIISAAEGGLAAARAYAEKLDQRTDRLALLAGVASAEKLPITLDGMDPFSGIVALDASPKLLASQISAAIRARVAEDEHARRLATAITLGAPVPDPPRRRPLKALYIGAPNPQFLELERAFAKFPGLIAAAFTSFCGFDYLHDEVFDAVVLNGAKDPSTAISLCAALRRNAQFHHLPTMVLTAQDDEHTARAAIDRGASVVAPANKSARLSLGWLFEAIRRERRRHSAEHDIRALRDVMGDPRTGLFRAAPFSKHLERMAADHHETGRPLSVAAMRVVAAHGASEPTPQSWEKGFSEIASLAGRLVRDTDCAAALEHDVIALALPATNLSAAHRTAERIASVAECTLFASNEGGAGPLIFEQSAAELQPGESGLGLLARATRQFDAERVPA
jgi:PleD family two-component response regulator